MRKFIFIFVAIFILSACSKAKETLPLENSIVMGDEDAKHKVVVFLDPDDPVCGVFQQEMKKIIAQRDDIAFYIRLFPLTNIHPLAYQKSKIISCAESDAEALTFLEQARTWASPLPQPSCDSDAVDKNLEFARATNLLAVPAIFFTKDDVAYGAFTADSVIAMVDGKASVINHVIVMK